MAPRTPVFLPALLALLSFVTGCVRDSHLHWQGGDTFGVFDAEGRAPSRIDCGGTTAQRFACFSARIRERAGETSGAFAVVTGDGVLLQTTTEPGQPHATTPETLFPLLSVTKMFTAATTVALAREGVLDLRRPIASYLSELDASTLVGSVTLHQLLTHTAGLLDDPRRPLCERGEPLSHAVERAHIGAQPGTVYLYSNIGYSLVGLVIERATSRRFEDVVHERVLVPTGMSTATFDFASVRVRGRPAGAGAAGRCRMVAPAGGLIASVRDVVRWARAMSEPATHPLGSGLVQSLTTPYVETGARPREAYGYGVGMMKRSGVWVYNHSGGIQDFSAFVAWVPARRFGAAATMNAANAAGVTPAAIALRGLSVLLGLPDDWSARADGAARPLRAYVGTYVDRRSWLGRLRVRIDGDRLAFDYPDGPPSLLPPSFVFRFVPGEEHARFVVTAVGVGERVVDEDARSFEVAVNPSL